MLRILKIVAGGFVPVAITVYVAAVGLRAQVDGVVDYWPFPWLWALAGSTAVSAMVWLVLMLAGPAKSRESKVAFTLKRLGDGSLSLERKGKTTAFAVRIGDGLVSGSNFPSPVGGYVIGDFPPGSVQNIGLPFQLPPGQASWIWFDWISGGERYYSKSQFVEGAVGEYDYRGILGKIGEPFSTQ